MSVGRMLPNNALKPIAISRRVDGLDGYLTLFPPSAQ